MASAYKYLGAAPSLVDALETFLASFPHGHVIAVGPGATGDWPRLARSPRARVFDSTPDVGHFQTAADVYVDSYPVGSITSLLESAARGTACVALQPPTAKAVLITNGPGLAALRRVPSVTDLADTLVAWAGDSHSRTRVGLALQSEVLAAHADSVIRDSINRVYDLAARELPAAGPSPRRQVQSLDRRLHELTQWGFRPSVQQAVAYSFGGRRALLLEARTVDRVLAMLERPAP
jgi:hypothetical protein